MPGKKKVNKLDRCVNKVMSTGKTKGASYAICNFSINRKKTKSKSKKK